MGTWIFDESTLPGVKLSDACANYATKTHSQLTEPLHIVSIIGVIAGMYLFVVVSLGKVYSRYRQQRLASCLTVAGFVAIPALAVLLSYALTLLVKWHKACMYGCNLQEPVLGRCCSACCWRPSAERGCY